jgi:hypothetical protein
MKIRTAVLLFTALLGVPALTTTARAETYEVFSQDFSRSTNTPLEVTEQFYAADGLVHRIRIYNGGRDQQFKKLSSGALITLNGNPLVRPRELNQRIGLLEKQAELIAQNELVIELRSAPGNGITIEILGTVELDLAYTEDMQLVWWNPPLEIPGGVSASPSPEWSYFGAFYRPDNIPEGYYPLGDYGEGISKSWPQPAAHGFMLLAKALEPGALAPPQDYELVWDSDSMAGTFGGYTYYLPRATFWRPIPQAGYACLGTVVQAGPDMPTLDAVRCVREDLTLPGLIGDAIWNNYRAQQPAQMTGEFGVWQVKPEGPLGISVGAFAGVGSQTVPPTGAFRCIDARQVKGAMQILPKIDAEDITQLVEAYGPSLRLYSLEKFFPDDAEISLDSAYLEWGLVNNEADYDAFNLQLLGSVPTSALELMNDVEGMVETDPSFTDPAFRQWLKMPAQWASPFDGSGDLTRARAYVHVLPWNWLFTELQFWLYYPFNGAGRVEICASSNACIMVQLAEAGRHYSDWEHVTLRFFNAGDELTGVYLSQHSGGRWYLQRDFGSALQFEYTHPKIYVAKYSHAHYANPGTHYYERIFSYDWGLGTASLDLFDLTNEGAFWPVSDPGRYTIISSAMPGMQISEPDWLQFEGRWGQYERLQDSFNYLFGTYEYEEVGAGPTGPAMKVSWAAGEPGPGAW